MSVLSAGQPADEPVGRRLATATRRRRLSQTKREWLAAYLFLLPDLLGLLIFVGLPMVLSLSLGFFNVSGFGQYTFTGLANYRKMLVDPLFIGSLQTTAKYVIVLVPGLYVIGLGLALLVKRPIPLIGAVPRHVLPAQCHQSGGRRADLAVPARRPDRGRQHALQQDRTGRAVVAGRSRSDALDAPRRDDLVPDGLLHADLPRRSAGDPARVLRRGPHRRRRALAVVPGYHPAAAETDELLRAARLARRGGDRARRASTSST